MDVVGNVLNTVTGIIPMDKIVVSIGGDMLGDLSAELEEAPKKLEELMRQQEEAEKEPNEKIKQKLKERLEKSKLKVNCRMNGYKNCRLKEAEGNYCLKHKAEAMTEDMREQIKKRVEAACESAQAYADQINLAASQIPAAAAQYAGQIVNLAIQASGAVSAAIMNPGSVAFSAPAILAATQAVRKAGNDLKAAVKSTISAIAGFNKCLEILTVVPAIAVLLSPFLLTISTVGVTLETAVSIIPII